MSVFKKFNRSKEPRVNRRIIASQVRVIGPDGGQLGVLALREALSKAEEYGLDLVEVAGQVTPPVCKIIDYGKYKYEQKKDQQRSKKKQTVIKLKEIKFGIMTDDHDIEHKLRKIREFLDEGDKVRLTVFFKGRQMMHQDLGKKVLDKVAQKLNDVATVEQSATFEGRNLFMILIPSRDKKEKGQLHEVKVQ
ncbi:MAG: translation initiation factor IF-3 [Deltaproteobacteria bacterium]|nr:translation initiation factor IF-3 [Deltaproteobacteria bacterium]